MNEAQIEAITTRVPNVLVSAGAGSGKTSVLTQRYFHLLDDVVDGRKMRLDEILTLTFTRKAAQEMRDRIAGKLEKEGRTFERRELARAPIGTIHSFCESILREHALQAGIDPNFRLLDDAEARTLQENALDTVFEDLWNGPQQEREEIGRLLLDMPQGRLRSGLLNIFRSSRTHCQKIKAAASSSQPIDVLAGELCAAIEELLSLEGTPKWRENLKLAEVAYSSLRPALGAAGEFNWDTYYYVQQSLNILTPRGGPGSASEAKSAVKSAAGNWLGAYLEQAARPYINAFLILLERLNNTYQQSKDEQGLLDFEDLLLITRNLLQDEQGGAVERLRKKYRQIMVDEFQDTNPLQFSIIEMIIGDNPLFTVGDVKQAIYRFIGSDIQVFLDQEKRILGMGEGVLRIPMHTNYRSRPEILEPLNGLFARLWPINCEGQGFAFEPLSAGRQFISKDNPSIEFAFQHCEKTTAAELREHEARWIANRILQLTGGLGKNPLQLSYENADQFLESVNAKFGDIIILFRSSTGIELYERALGIAGIPYYTVSGRGFYASREIQDIVYLLRAVENPIDDFSLAVVLRSPLVGISDDSLYWISRNWGEWKQGEPFPAKTSPSSEYGRLWANIERIEELPPIPEDDRAALVRFRGLLRYLQPEMTAGQPLDLIDAILSTTEYLNVLLAMDGGERKYANVQKLREVAATFQGRGIFDLSDFQRYLTQLSEMAPREASAPVDVEGSNVVRLMTIHAAKGLEAPIVFLADCGREPNSTSETFLMTADGIACQAPTPEDDWAKPASYQRAAERIALEEKQEAERLLYVALTRAKEHLICSGFTNYPAPEKRFRFADILAGLLGLIGPCAEDADVPVIFEGNNYPIRVWSDDSLSVLEGLTPPAPESTLFDEFADKILSGKELPILTPSKLLEQYSRIVDRLQPLPPMRREGPLRIGVHRIICYDVCPRQYWLRYVLHDEGSPILPRQIEDEPFAAIQDDDHAERLDGTQFGTALHAVMQRIDFTQPLPEQLPDILEQLPEKIGKADEQRLAQCLGRFMTMPGYREMRSAKLIQPELRFLAHEGGVFMPGIIDALVKTDDRCWIIDYKTGHPSANHMRQVALYALGVEHTLDAYPEKVALAYVDDAGPRNYRVERVTKELLDEGRRLIRNAGEGIGAKKFNPTPGRHCQHCPYTAACPQGRECLPLNAPPKIDNVTPSQLLLWEGE